MARRPAEDLLVGIDGGTTNARSAVFSVDGELQAIGRTRADGGGRRRPAGAGSRRLRGRRPPDDRGRGGAGAAVPVVDIGLTDLAGSLVALDRAGAPVFPCDTVLDSRCDGIRGRMLARARPRDHGGAAAARKGRPTEAPLAGPVASGAYARRRRVRRPDPRQLEHLCSLLPVRWAGSPRRWGAREVTVAHPLLKRAWRYSGGCHSGAERPLRPTAADVLAASSERDGGATDWPQRAA
jgi:hypothetical protein